VSVRLSAGQPTSSSESHSQPPQPREGISTGPGVDQACKRSRFQVGEAVRTR
jgi:hypothetical protein